MKSKPARPPAQPDVITDIAALQSLCQAPLPCRFKLDGRDVEIPCRRLLPREQELLLAKQREVRPTRIPGKTPEEDRYDTSSADYLARRDRNEKTVRALGIYLGCPAVAAAAPGLGSDHQKIYEHVQGLFTEMILELLFATIVSGGVEAAEREVADRANFTTSPESAGS